MSMDKVYNPGQVESEVYRRWLEAGVFAADPARGGPAYCIVIPPPNVTDRLHLGHALNNTLQDVLVRHHRMAGANTLWMPGTDHAGIATQTVVEKRILAEEGRRRTDFRREEFVERVRAWKDEYERTILDQLKAMGCSCDWDRTRFTMDEVCARAVREAFVRLFADGLIYRGKRLVNWDPATQTVLADDEVEHETVQGHFWYMKYPLKEAVRTQAGQVLSVTVATTRPETMLGDTAVAMNPADPRAKDLVGRTVRLPIVGREIPIIADDSVVLPGADGDDERAAFSTGFLKVTPAHDLTDWEIGQKHDLPVINVLAPDGTISDRYGWEDWEAIRNPDVENLIGMDRFEAREAVVEWFRAEGLLEEVRPYAHEVGHSYRSHVPIEPYLSDQWFIAVRKPIPDWGPRVAEWAGEHADLVETRDGVPCVAGTSVPLASLAGLALMPLLDGRLRFVPERYAAVYRAWLENLRDWPISRQLWWGHRIPVWSKPGEAPPKEDDLELIESMPAGDTERMVATDQCIRPEWREHVSGQAHYDSESGKSAMYHSVRPGHADIERAIEKQGFRRDPDVLDTWFSSALWPVSTMGWPEETELLKGFYPTSVLCTAREIITLWVSRMVMFGQYFRGDTPFADVYIHAMIQDGEGRKMSKSLGNGIDPLDIIASHGADAMRFTLAYMTTETQDVRMPVEAMTLPDGREANTSPKFDIGRNFCNKLWNASRFALMNLQGAPSWEEARPSASPADAWVLSRMNRTVADVTEALSAYRFHEAAAALYRYMWNDFCDWYLELAKVRIADGAAAPKAVLAHALDVLLRLLHPFVPFITEAIWSQLNAAAPHRGPGDTPAEPFLAAAAWPRAEASAIRPDVEQRFDALRDLIGGVREVRSRHNVPVGRKVRVTVAADVEQARPIDEGREAVTALAGVEDVRFDPAAEASGSDATVLAGGLRALVHDVIDVAAERDRLTRQAETLRKGVRGIEAKLANEQFLTRAPAEVVRRERDRLARLSEELAAVEKSLGALT